jgi:hypothetical protein
MKRREFITLLDGVAVSRASDRKDNTHLSTAGDCCAAGFRSSQCLLCVLLVWFGAVSADPKRSRIQRYTKTGVFVCVRTLVVTLPSTTAASPPRPCDPMTMRSQPLSEAAAIMA